MLTWGARLKRHDSRYGVQQPEERGRMGQYHCKPLYGDGRARAALLLALRALTVLGVSANRPVSREVGYCPQEQANGRRFEAALPVGLLHQFEGHRGDQHPRTYGHYDRDDPL